MTTKCIQCFQEPPAGAEFCPECGAGLTHACPDCGAPNAANHKYCLKCGHRLPVVENTREAPAPAVVNAPAVVMNPIPVRLHQCPECRKTAVERDVTASLSSRIVAYVAGQRRYACRSCRARFSDRPTRPKLYR
ncbi:MAG: zinc ribbon domain-containing protein [Candidatus Rokubacteria bacterium]|nr:zinc ribbon domain-containing protein [Candidatus Rokubacteria bacterium]